MIAFDASEGIYTVDYARSQDPPRRLKLQCDSFKLGENKPIVGHDACTLRVGTVLKPLSPDDPNYASGLQIEEFPAQFIAITDGLPNQRFSQHFNIMSDRLLP